MAIRAAAGAAIGVSRFVRAPRGQRLSWLSYQVGVSLQLPLIALLCNSIVTKAESERLESCVCDTSLTQKFSFKEAETFFNRFSLVRA